MLRFSRVLTPFIAVLWLADASAARVIKLDPVTRPTTVMRGVHVSACSPITLENGHSYARLALSFSERKYRSSETLYSDPKCEISVLETTSEGSWTITRGQVLSLRLARMQIRPLDPRMADRLTNSRACGKTWNNGSPTEILDSTCGKSRHADYFIGQSPSGKSIQLYDCGGQKTISRGCNHYAMAKNPSNPASAKVLKLQASRQALRNQAIR